MIEVTNSSCSKNNDDEKREKTNIAIDFELNAVKNDFRDFEEDNTNLELDALRDDFKEDIMNKNDEIERSFIDNDFMRIKSIEDEIIVCDSQRTRV